jgi:hypothetical protein
VNNPNDNYDNEGVPDNNPDPVIQNEAATMDPPTETVHLRRSSRPWKPSRRYLESQQQEEMSLQALVEAAKYDDECEVFIDNICPITLLSQLDKDTMYFDQAMKRTNFCKQQ